MENSPSPTPTSFNLPLTFFPLTAVFGPAATTWFSFLQRTVVLRNKNLEILARVGLDQCLFASTNLFVFLTSMALMEGSSVKAKLKSTYTQALSKNWMVWPFVQAVNFKFVPLVHRVLVVNVVSLGKFQLRGCGPFGGRETRRGFGRVRITADWFP